VCGFANRYVRPCSRIDSPRKQASGSVRVESLDLFSFRCQCGKKTRSDDSHRPWGICLVGPSLVHTLNRWITAKSRSSRKSEVGIFRKTHYYQKVQARASAFGVGIGRARQILVLLSVEQVGGKIEKRSQKLLGNPAAPTFMQTPISSTVRRLVSRVCCMTLTLTSTCARHPPVPPDDQD
jgi:hypothetical protein